MKTVLVSLNNKHFVLLVMFFAFVSFQSSNGMMPSKKHQAITFDRAQVAKARGMKDPVWVKTIDGRIVPIEKWKIDQMKLLQVILEDQGGLSGSKKPVIKPEFYVNEQWFTLEELNLLSGALDAASVWKFEEFYNSIGSADALRMLINAAQKVEAIGLSALCGSYYFPKELQQVVVKDIVQPVVEYIKCNNIKKTLVITGQKTIRSVAFSPDGTKIAVGFWSGECGVIVIDAYSHKILHKILSKNSKVTAVGFSNDSKKLVVGCYGLDNKLTVWNVQTGEELLAIFPDGDVRTVGFSNDDTKIISGSMNSDASLVAWSAQDGNKIWETTGYRSVITSIALSLDGTKIVSGAMGDHDNLMMWNVDDGKLLHNFGSMPTSIYSVAISPDGTKIAYGRRGHIVILDAKTGEKIYSVSGHSLMVYSIAFSRDGKYIVSGGDWGTVILWDVQSGEKLCNLVGHKGNVLSVAISPDGDHIVSGAQQLLSWQLPTDLIKAIENNGLTISQARLLYQMYCAADRGIDMILKKDTLEYIEYDTLPELIKQEICTIFPVKFEDCTIEEQQENSTCYISQKGLYFLFEHMLIWVKGLYNEVYRKKESL